MNWRHAGSGGTMAGKANKNGTDSGHLDLIHERLWARSRIRTIYRISILANFYNLIILPVLEREFDILRDDFNILFCLADAGPMTGTDVCRITGRPRNSVSRSAERLVRRKLIAARAGSEDRRTTTFAILPAGRKLYRSMLPHFEEAEEQMFSSLSGIERDVLDKVLTKLVGEHSKWDRMF